jgi:DNA primase
VIDVSRLIESISDEEIINILEHLGCDNYKEHRNYITFSTSVCHGGEHLNLIYYRETNSFYCFSECKCSYNIITLVEKVYNYNFVKALQFVSDFIGRTYDQEEEIKDEDVISDWKWIKKLKKKNKQKQIVSNKILLPMIMNQYIQLPHELWVQDGIKPKTQNEWGIAYDLKSDRIIYGIYDENNNLVGVKGRSVESDIDDDKYIYLYPCYKNLILTGLNKTLPYILSEKKCLVFESFKSLLLSWQWGYRFAVSLEGSSVSDWQREKLITMGLEIIFAFDKDVNNLMVKNKDGSEIKYLTKIKEIFRGKTELSFMYDKNDLLDEKMSPTDRGLEVFKEMYDKRLKIK